MLRYRLLAPAILISMTATATSIHAQQPSGSMDSAYVAKVMTAAPAAVAQGATIVEMQGPGTMRMIKVGTNGFTCMVLPGGGGTPMCADKNAMEWLNAVVKHAAPPDSVGFIYMLGGDEGASNTDPDAKAPTPSNHWVKTGPHVMIVGPAAKTLGYPMTAQPDVTKPYVMWPDTPYAHAMIPVTTASP